MPDPQFSLSGAFGAGPNRELELRAQLAQDPADIAAARELADLLAQQGRAAEAMDLLNRALDRCPDDQNARATLAALLLHSGNFERALKQFKQLRPPLRTSFETQTSEAGALGMLGRHAEQVEIYRKLLRQHPNDPRLWERLGNALKYLGRTAEAVRAFQRSVKIDASYGEGWWALANVKTFRFGADDVTAMRKALAGPAHPLHTAQLHYALGKALEDQGEFEESFRHYAEGNRIKATEFSPEQMSTARLTDYVNSAIATFDAALLSTASRIGDDGNHPIFVVGLQRSGSTLVEQILASHSSIEGLAEPDAMLHVWTDLESAAAKSGKTVWEAIGDLTSAGLDAIAAEYLQRIAPFRKERRPFFVDKRPANWMYVGLIRLVLPNAKIVDARRHPMASGFSNFKQCYAGNAFPFSYNLSSIGRYYAEYVRLMRHFDALQPGAIHHVLNEELIEDPEGQIRRLLDYVGVPFEPACLEFHRTKRAVTTASAEQVRTPLNRQGVDQWRNFDPWLGELRNALGPTLSDWDEIPR